MGPWGDAMGIVGAVTCFEAAFGGYVRHRRSKRTTPVAGWFRPILGIVGIGLLVFAVWDYMQKLR